MMAAVFASMRYGSVCSGMEAASVAWHPLGWTPAFFSEIEPFPCAILSTRFPHTPNHGSLTEYKSWPVERGAIDLLVGGTPCQSFSVAGLRKGLADPRGNLALTFLGLADRLKPKWIVWENVPGVLSSGGGRDFGSFLGALVELGYGFAYRVLDAQHFGVPQRRRRVFVVACLGDWRAPAEVLSLREGLRGYLEAGGKKRKGVAADAGSGVEAGVQRTVGTLCADTHPGAYSGQDAYSGRLIPATKSDPDVQPYTASSFAQYAEGVGTVRASGGDLGGGSETLLAGAKSHWEGSDIHPTLNQSAKGSGGVGASNQELFSQGGAYLVPGQPIPIQDGREMEKNQNGMGVGNPGDPAYTIDTTGAQAAGIPFRKSKRACSTTDNETWVPADVTNRLNNFDLGDTRTTHAVVEPFIIKPSELRLTGKITPQNICPTPTAGAKQGDTEPCAVQHVHCSDVAPTVTSSGPPYSRTGNERVEAEALAITFQPGNLRREAGAEPSTTTLKASAGDQSPHVATIHPTVTTCTGVRQGCSAEAMSSLSAMQAAGAYPTMAVRRLTPVECERLQGFPDNWSRIPWKGKPEEDCPDGPRYKACGNSMAVPVMRWIGERIANYELNNPSQNHEAK